MERRRPFRLRFPWSAPPAPSSTNETPGGSRPTPTQTPTPTPPTTTTRTRGQTTATQTRAPPTTTTPTQIQPSRPPGTAPTKPIQAPKPESQPSSTSRKVTKSEPASQQRSPSRVATQILVASQPPSPSPEPPQKQPASPTSSPSRTSFQPEKTSQTPPQPQSTSRLASEPAGKTSPIPSSPVVTPTQVQPNTAPSKTSQSTTQESSRPQPSSTEAPPPISEKEEVQPVVSQPQPVDPQTKTEIISDTTTKSHNQNSAETNYISPNGIATQPSNLSCPTEALETPASPQKSSSFSISADDPKPLSESDEKSTEPKEGKGAVQKTTGVASDESKKKSITELHTVISDSNAETKKHPDIKFQTEEKKQQEKEVLSTKEMITTSVSNEKQTKPAISHPKDKSTVTESRKKATTFKGEHVPLHKEIRDDISKFVNGMAIGREKLMSVTTLAGDNRGASMHLGSESATKEGVIHIHRGYKINPNESTDATIDGEESSNTRRPKDSNTKEDKVTKAYINSNLQGLNNSIMLSSSITQKNPGVRLVLCHNPIEPIQSKSKTESLETHKAEFNTTPSQKLIYEPTVKRRCLRGLFMESSDSDPDNPEKPRRHGCRYGCRNNSTNKDTDVI